MAKTTQTGPQSSRSAGAKSQAAPASEGKRAAEGKLMDFAEELGRLLGSAEAKASAWLDQREAVSKQLIEIRDRAAELLNKLGSEGAELAAAVRRGRKEGPAASKSKAGGNKTSQAASPARKNEY